MTTNPLPIRRALISVSDKAGLAPFAARLAAQGVVLVSTGGSAAALRAAGLTVTEVADVTGFPEMLDGRVKTLHPAIHAGILARRDRPEHVAALAAQGIAPIDLLVCNLYPFIETVAQGADPATAIETIDIGGVALIRAAAKNHDFVAVMTDPGDYGPLLDEMAAHDGAVGAGMRRALARRAFAHTAAYDAAIADWMARADGIDFPETVVFAGRLAQQLRYGENPHQAAAFYASGEPRPGVATARQLQGKELSYNNYNDTDAAFDLVAEFAEPAVAIIKHTNPCGAAVGADLAEAWGRALECDPLSAYGGIVAVNRRLDHATAEAIAKIFVEVVIAPDAAEDAVAALARRSALRLLLTGGMPDPQERGREFRSLAGGFLLQQRDALTARAADLRVVTKRAPDISETADLLFAEKVAKHVKSNAIVLAKGGATIGIGAGQMSRVGPVELAARQAGEKARGSALASDAFFPFADGVEAAIAAGVAAIIQPGGSVRDEEVIAAADKAGVAMVFTGTRHFRH
jgi:phosphoribosylaminoimidazolecarboxamide formyltransferase / IMP cyclohydrolase